MERTDRESTAPAATDGVSRATGRSRQEWFAALDGWGAAGRPYREIAAWLTGEQGLSGWWAQKLTIEYEEARGVRPPGVRRDGTFEVGASKIVAAAADEIRRAFAEPERRALWLGTAPFHETGAKPGSIQFDWDDGTSRVTVTLDHKGETKTLVAVRHDRLRDAGSAANAKAFWRERLEALKSLFEPPVAVAPHGGSDHA